MRRSRWSRFFHIQLPRVWNQFCNFTSIAGFRFMTTRISLPIRWSLTMGIIELLYRLSALVIFLLSLLAFSIQIYLLVAQYLSNRLDISSMKFRQEQIPLPIVYVCSILDGWAFIRLTDYLAN